MQAEQNLLNSDIQLLVEKITTSGRISRADQHKFMSALLAKNSLSRTEQHQINRIFDLLRAGRLRVVD